MIVSRNLLRRRSLENKPEDVDDIEWKFLVEHFSSEAYKKMSERNKINKAKQEMNHICGRKSFQSVSFAARDPITENEPNFQKLWEITHKKSNGLWVNNASAELNDKVKELADEQIQEMEEDTNVDAIYNNAFVKVVGEKSRSGRGQGVGVKSASRKSMEGLKEQLQTQQKEREEERNKLIEVQNKLEEEQKNRKLMEARLENQQKMLKHQQKTLKEGMLALASHLLTSQNGLPDAILNLISDSSSDDANPASPIDDIMDEHL